jgi:hypothetical protein
LQLSELPATKYLVRPELSRQLSGRHPRRLSPSSQLTHVVRIDRAKLCRPASMCLRARQDRQCDRPWPEPYSDWLFHPRVSRPTLGTDLGTKRALRPVSGCYRPRSYRFWFAERGAMFGSLANFEVVDAETMRPSPRPAVDECLTSHSAGSSIIAGPPPVEFRERGGRELRER